MRVKFIYIQETIDFLLTPYVDVAQHVNGTIEKGLERITLEARTQKRLDMGENDIVKILDSQKTA